MNQDELRSIMREFYGSPLSFLEVEDGETRIKMKKPVGQQAASALPVVPEQAANVAVQAAPQEAAAAENEHLFRVKSPLVGVFYAAPAPDEEPFVLQGQHVEEGDILCLVEAMKMMNEIKAPKAGTVRWIAVENAATVGFDDLLMEIEAD